MNDDAPAQNAPTDGAVAADANKDACSPSHPSKLWILALIVASVSLTLRVIWVLFAHVTPISDFAGYDRLAWGWLEDGAFQLGSHRAYRTPGYPGFLALVYFAFGRDYTAAGLVQAALGGLTSGMLVLLAARLVSSRAAVLAGLLHAFSPTAVAYVPVLASENLSVPLIVGGLLCLALQPSRRLFEYASVAAAGLALGLLLLARPAAVFFLPAFAALAVYHPLARRWRPGALLALGLPFILVLTPWVIRNQRIGLGPITLSTTGGVNLWMGNNPNSVKGGFLRSVQDDNTSGERERDRAYKERALSWIRQFPERYFALCGVRAARLLGTVPDHQAATYLIPTAASDALMRAAYAARKDESLPQDVRVEAHAAQVSRLKLLENARHVAAPLTLLALILSLRRPRAFAIVLLPIACYGAGLSATYLAERFRELWNPLLYVPLAALLSDIAFGTRDLGRFPRRMGKAGLALAAVLASIWCTAAGHSRHWYVLTSTHDQTPDASTHRSSARPFDDNPGRHRSRWSYGAEDLDIHLEDDGLHCDFAAGTDDAYGGVRFRGVAAEVVRVELSFVNPGAIRDVYVDGYDGKGYDAEKNRMFRWQWKVSPVALPNEEPASFTLVPGERTGYFRERGDIRPGAAADVHVFIKVRAGRDLSYTPSSSDGGTPNDRVAVPMFGRAV